jgi:hypothetical protein
MQDHWTVTDSRTPRCWSKLSDISCPLPGENAERDRQVERSGLLGELTESMKRRFNVGEIVVIQGRPGR